ncbi:MAG TPA: glycoside hydrolase family 43 protein [Candidatus Polarisedimenticolia bacterium]|nr:glycoside hydrolase family 43 protein [Candidatus Polarisedimenticolia bacterium]
MKTAFGRSKKSLALLAGAAIILFLIPSRAVAASGSLAGTDSVYLFTSFHNADQKFLRFLYSDDGYHWTNVPGTFLEANVGEAKQLRDPSLLRGPDGTYQLVWTTGWHDPKGFGHASSTDLIHWSEQQFVPVMTNEPTTVNVWAPELFYDGKNKQFIITWASTIPGRFPDLLESHTNNHRLYFTTTRDFKTFTPAKLFLDPGFSVIDPYILKDGDRYVLLCKDNSRPNLNLRVAFSDSPLGPWKNMSAPITRKFTEGPCALKVGDDWLIYFDPYREKMYGAAKTHDFKTFADLSGQVFFPEGHKHGTALVVPRAILEGLLKSYSANQNN